MCLKRFTITKSFDKDRLKKQLKTQIFSLSGFFSVFSKKKKKTKIKSKEKKTVSYVSIVMKGKHLAKMI